MQDDLDSNRRIELALVACITLIGAGLRFYRLDNQSLWHDELLTFLSSSGTWAHVLFQAEIKTNILPFYYLVTHAFLGWGTQEIALRAPSVFFGLLTIPLLYQVVRQGFSGQVGLWASCLLAISPFHIFYSQEARPYAMYVFLCLLAFALLQHSVKHHGSRLLNGAFAIVGASTFYCHTAAIPFLAFLGLYVCIQVPRDQWRNWVPTFLTMAVLILPVLYRVVVMQVGGQGEGRSFEAFYIPYVLWAFTTGFSLGPTLFELHLVERFDYIIPHLAIIVPVLLGIFGLALNGAREIFLRSPRKLLVFVLFFFLPLAFVGLAALVTSRPFNVRHIIPSLIPFLVFLAVGIQSLPRTSLKVFCAGIFLLISVASLNSYYFDGRYQREDNRGAAHFLDLQSNGDDLVICATPYTTIDLIHYVSPERKNNIVAFPVKSMDIRSPLFQKEVHDVLNGREQFWVFYSRTFDARPSEKLEAYFDDRYVPRQEFQSSGVRLVQYQTESHSPIGIPDT